MLVLMCRDLKGGLGAFLIPYPESFLNASIQFKSMNMRLTR